MKQRSYSGYEVIDTPVNFRVHLTIQIQGICCELALRKGCSIQKHCISGKENRKSVYKRYDELPLFLNAETVAKALGISPSSGYELMHEQGLMPW